MKKTYYFRKRKAVRYNEIFADSDVFEKFYEIENAGNADLVCIPDGSVDIQCLWKDGHMDISVCGSVTSGKVSAVNDYDKCFGARFKVGGVPDDIRKNLDIIIDNRIPLSRILNTEKMDAWMREELFLEQKADIMLSLFEKDALPEENPLISYLICNIEKNRGHVIIRDIVDSTGYSHRYVNHVFKNNVGYSIKKYAGIERLQASLFCLLNEKDDVIYNELGYYDQAHFIKDFKNFSTITPNIFKKDSEKIAIV